MLDDAIKDLKNQTKKLHVGYRNMQVVEIAECAFADDLIVFAKNEQDLQTNLNLWKTALQQRNMKININKTKVMVIGKNNIKVEISLDGRKLEQVDTFKYLGVNIHKSGTEDVEVVGRIESTNKLYYALCNTFVKKKEITQKTKITVYNTVYKPVLTYGCETWNISKQMKSKIQTLEMKYLRAVKGVTRRDKIRNQKVREDLKVEPILEYMDRQKMKWFGHITRMGENRQVKRVWLARTTDKKTRGRPRKTWDNTVAECLKKRGKTWNEGTKLAKNKKEWTKFIHN